MLQAPSPAPVSPAAALSNSAAFLLAKVGAGSAQRYKQRLQPLGLGPQQAALLRYIASGDGLSQQALADALQLARSRMVVLIDELEQRKLVKRRRSAIDRRAYALALTSDGQRLLDELMRVSRDYETELCEPLGPEERDQLITLLCRLAAKQDIPLNVHPALANHAAPTRAAASVSATKTAPRSQPKTDHPLGFDRPQPWSGAR